MAKKLPPFVRPSTILKVNCCLLISGLFLIDAAPQNPTLQRSNSDPRFDRNATTNVQRQSSFSENSCSLNYKFDYLLLSLSWPPGSCSTSPQECRKGNNKQFNIHGLWPTIRGTLEPSNCCYDSRFNFRALEPILADLDRYWYSYYDANSNRGFWAHEWRKHGTCSRNIPSLKGETRYFGTTVQMAKQLPVLETLSKSRIKPDNSQSYESSDISKALESLSQGRIVQVECDYELSQPVPILTGVNFCFDSNLKPTDCPQTWRKCQRKLMFRNSPSRT